MDHHGSSISRPISSKAKYGDRYLHSVFDDVCITEPDRLYASVHVSIDQGVDFIDLTFGDVAHCVNVFASLLERTIGRSNTSETVAYLGIPDIRNVIVFLAAVKCGYKVWHAPRMIWRIADLTSCSSCRPGISHRPARHF